MKKIILTVAVLLLTLSCKNGGKAEKESAKTHEVVKTDTENHEHEGEVHLSQEQILSAKIKIEPIAKHKVRNQISVTGSIQAPPKSKATIYTPLESFVYKADLLVGDRVRKGQTIAVLQHPNFTNLQYNYLESLNKQTLAEQEFKRKEMLFKNDIVSRKDYQLAESSLLSAKSLVQSYASQLKMAGLSPQKIKKEGIQQYVYVKSPISGYIVTNNLNKGQFLSANSEMMQIVDNDHMHAELNVFNTDIDKIKKNDSFIFKAEGSEKEYNGYIKQISQLVGNDTKSINVHGHFTDKDRSLKVGTFINAKIFLEGKMVYAVPKEAVVEIEGKQTVFQAESEDEFIPLEVTIGDSDNGFVEIKSIENNDFSIQIVTQGAYVLVGEYLKGSGEMDGHGHAH